MSHALNRRDNLNGGVAIMTTLIYFGYYYLGDTTDEPDNKQRKCMDGKLNL